MKIPNYTNLVQNQLTKILTLFTFILIFASSNVQAQCPAEVSDLPADFTVDAGMDCAALVSWTEPSFSLDCGDFDQSFDATDPSIWSLETNGDNGSVNLDGAPATISITGSSNGTAGTNTDTDFCITVPFDGNLSFDWTSTALGGGAQLINDEAAYTLDGVEVILNVLGSPVGTGVATESGMVVDLAVSAGQVFCFRVKSNNQGATTNLDLSNFNFEITEINKTAGIDNNTVQDIGAYTVEYSVADCDGVLSTCNFTVTVSEGVDPMIVCPADITMSTDPDRCTSVVCFGLEVSDNCPAILEEEISDLEFIGTFNGHNYFVSDDGMEVDWETANLLADEMGGNLVTITSQAEQDYLVDNLPNDQYWIGLRYSPSLDLFKWVSGEEVIFTDWGIGQPGGINGDYVYTWDFFGTFADGWYDSPALLARRYIVEVETYKTTLIAGLPSGANFPLGTTAVTYEVEDASGNTAQCSFNVVVEDNQVPLIECRPDTILNLEALECETIVEFEDPMVDDNCPGVTFSQIDGLPSGSSFPIGINEVVFEAIDAADNRDTCSFNVIVNEFEPEGLACIESFNFSLDPDTCEGVITPAMVLLTEEVGCLDSCTVTVMDNGVVRPALMTSADIGMTFQYEVCCGIYCCEGMVVIEDKVAPTITCTDVTISCAGVGNIPEPTVGDDCQNTTLTLINEIKTNIDCDDEFIGMIQRTYVGEDSSGNQSAPCTQTIMLERIVVGSIIPPAPLLQPDNNLVCGSNYPVDENGNPDPVFSGVPMTASEFTYVETDATFNYVDISAIENRVVAGDDVAVPVELGAPFNLYGMTFNSLAVSENGYITTDLADNGPDLSNDCPLPSDPSTPFNTTGARLYPLHDDLEADISQDATAGVYYQYFPVSPVVTPRGVSTGVSIFQWRVDHFDANGAVDLDFQALLFDNGEITYQYNMVGTEMGNGATVGTQSFAMENDMQPLYGTTISCNTPNSILANTAVGLRPPSGEGVPLFPFDASVFCNGYSEYSDQVLSVDGCITKILRTFTIGEWHCNSTNEVQVFQMIDIVDETAPSVSQPADVTVSTASFSCAATVELPAVTVSDDCNEPVAVDITYPGGFINNQNGGLATLDVGDNLITYTVYDDCGNSTSVSNTVTVVDNADPIAICDNFDVVSISTTGQASITAEAIDDGSFDECGPVTLSVARMDAEGFDDGSAFAERVEFDCTDIGATIMVALMVEDMGGNSNMCMVQVTVQDKVDAFITCPADITIDCSTPYDLNNLETFGTVEVVDNCEVTPVDEQVVTDLNQCGLGTITRTFTVLDNGQRTCTQVITIENQNDPLTIDDINWPDDYSTTNGCTEGGLQPEDLDNIDPRFGFPTYEDNTVCIATGQNFVDEEFQGGNGACRTIYRTWSVIDWCGQLPDGSFPRFDSTQVITIDNITAPEITSSTDTIFVESFAADCGPVPVTGLVVTATDDCTPSENLFYGYAVDLDSDGTDDITGSGSDASGAYPLGEHTVRFNVTDGCGNQVFGTRVFSIVNLKTATPYCLDNISTNLTLMDPDGDGQFEPMAMLTTDIFDAGSFHGCGYGIQLSFSQDVNDDVLVVDCNDLGFIDVQLWVTDENGNADFCETSLEVQDNDGICGVNPNPLVGVRGIIYTEAAEEVEEVTVGLMSVDALYKTSNDLGEYAFENMNTGGDYMVVPGKNDNHSNGVSTLDLVLVQRHILGLGELDSPYKLIAADVNNNEAITASDVVTLRKLVLGVYTEFPDNTSWRFIDADFDFPEYSNPWLSVIPEDYEINNLNQDMNIDFVGVKTGDVNGSVTANAQSVDSEVRNDLLWSIAIDDRKVKVGEMVEIEVKATEDSKVYGWQYTLATEDLAVVNITPGVADVTSQNTYERKGRLNMSYHNAQGHDLQSGQVIYTLTVQAQSSGLLSELLSITDRGIRSESYHEGFDISEVHIRWDNEITEVAPVREFAVMQNEPNPWKDMTSIRFYVPNAGDVSLVIKDVAGRTLFNKSSHREAGEHTETLSNQLINKSGVLFYELHFEDQVISNKMILMD